MTSTQVEPSDLLNPDLHARGDPYAVWRWMRRNAPVHWHPEGEWPGFWSMTRHEDVRMVYQNPAVFSSASGVLLRPVKSGEDPGAGLALALTDRPRHLYLRRVVARWFAEPHVRSLEEAIRVKARRFLDEAVEKGECEFVQDVAARLALHMICELMGVPERDLDLVCQWTNEAFGRGLSLLRYEETARYFGSLMEERMMSPTDGIMSELIQKEVDGGLLSEQEILLNCENIVGAAENAGLSMAGGVLAFLRHPAQWRELKTDLSLLASAVEETLRWTSSATHSVRTVKRSIVARGRKLEPGDKVALWIPSANRDEDVFPDPDRFDIARRDNRHLAFGAGEHFCVGNVLARAQMRQLLLELLDDRYQFELSGDVSFLRSIAVSGPATMPMRIRVR